MDNTTIGDWFGRKHRFEIPNYQRAYSWEEREDKGVRNFSQFIEDLKECGDSYYLGHFLFEKREENGNTILSVIDGQQRLTTCVIFFSVARKVLRLRHEEWEGGEKAGGIARLLEEIYKYYLKNDYGEQRFKTVGYDNDFFRDAIIDYKETLPEEDTNSRKAIHNARSYFEAELKNVPEIDTIYSWVKKLENASITTHIVEGKGQAAQIFAYQNDRGKPLTSLEVLKAYLLLQLFNLDSKEGDRRYNDDIERIEDKFKAIYHKIACIEHEDEDSILNYYWKAKGPQGYESKDTVKEVKEWLKGFPEKEQAEKIKEFVMDLSMAFELAAKIEANNSFDKETAFYIENLKRITSNRLDLPYPLLIRAQALKEGDETETFTRLVKLMENMMFRHYVIRRYKSANLKRRFDAILRSASDTKSLNDKIDWVKCALNNEWKWMYWSDDDMLGNIGRDDFYSKNQHVAIYLLWRYEQYLCDKINYPDPVISINRASLEHIAPQTPPDNLQESGYGVYYDEENPEEGIASGRRLHCVGNLALMALGKNIHAKNGSFEKKLGIYNDKNLLHQQKEIRTFATGKDTEHPVWDRAAIERRRDAIVAAAREIWSLGKI